MAQELKPAKTPIKELRDHDYYWFIGPDRPFIAELVGGDWQLPGEAGLQSTATLEEQGLFRWRRVQFPVDMRKYYGISKGYGREEREKRRKKSKELKRAERKFFTKSAIKRER